MSQNKKILLLLVDLLLSFATLAIALNLRYQARGIEYDFWEHATIFLPVFALWILVFYMNQIYDYFRFGDRIFLLYATSRSILINFGLTAVFFYIIPKLTITPKTILLIMVFFSLLFTFFWRLIFWHIFSHRILLKKTVIIGNLKKEINLAKELQKNTAYGYDLLGIISDGNEQRNKIKNLGRIEDLSRILQTHLPNTIVVDIDNARVDDLTWQKMTDYCISQNSEVVDLFFLYEKISGRIPLTNIRQIWFANLNQPVNKSTLIFKRLIDIFAAICGLFIFLPFLPLLYLIVKLDSPGPFFYTQKRMGAKGKVFSLYKIRTMYQDSEGKKAIWASRGDKRVTAVGYWLRKTSLDEIPQLYNILIGEMSLVGPRPERPEFIAKLTKREKFYYKRHLVKPGLTGWAQVMMGYGRSFSDSDEKLQYDLYYIKNRSIFLDLIIILRTIRMLFVDRGGI